MPEIRAPFRGIDPSELTINGTIKPTYIRDIPDEMGRQTFAVGPTSWKAICEGYACGNCLQYAAFRGSWSPRCPSCNAETGAGGPLQLAEPWWLT